MWTESNLSAIPRIWTLDAQGNADISSLGTCAMSKSLWNKRLKWWVHEILIQGRFSKYLLSALPSLLVFWATAALFEALSPSLCYKAAAAPIWIFHMKHCADQPTFVNEVSNYPMGQTYLNFYCVLLRFYYGGRQCSQCLRGQNCLWQGDRQSQAIWP